jgi:hypothetical protein
MKPFRNRLGFFLSGKHGPRVLENEARYEGEWVAGVPEGKGTAFYASGNRYEGDSKAGVREGKGTLFFANGDRYEGDWKAGVKEGKGTAFYADGARYEGVWKADVREGKGTLFFANGDRYEGDWKADVCEGKGTYYAADGARYEGDWKAGVKEGKGTLFIPDGSRYEGDWKAGVCEGKGTLFLADGARYEGDWKAGVKEGKGTAFYADGARYEGDWKAGVKEGKGTAFYADGARYEGDWREDVKEGKGTLFYADGYRYEGDWKGGVREGIGISFFVNGDRFEGDWKNDSRDGRGIWFYSNGDRYEGAWQAHKKEGCGTFYYAIGCQYEAVWRDDKQETAASMTDTEHVIQQQMKLLTDSVASTGQLLVYTRGEFSQVQQRMADLSDRFVKRHWKNGDSMSVLRKIRASYDCDIESTDGFAQTFALHYTNEIEEFNNVGARAMALRRKTRAFELDLRCYSHIICDLRNSTSTNCGEILQNAEVIRCIDEMIFNFNALTAELWTVRQTLLQTCQNLVRAPQNNSRYALLILHSAAPDWKQAIQQCGLQDKTLVQCEEIVEEFNRLKTRERYLLVNLNVLRREVRCSKCKNYEEGADKVSDEIVLEAATAPTRDQGTQISTDANKEILDVTLYMNRCNQSLRSLESQHDSVQQELLSVCHDLVRSCNRKSKYVRLLVESTAVDWQRTKLQYGLDDRFLAPCEENIKEFNHLKAQGTELADRIDSLKREVRCCECMLRDLYDKL